jgi:lipoprotein-anchoring transpeptidase ErfK/SrfK
MNWLIGVLLVLSGGAAAERPAAAATGVFAGGAAVAAESPAEAAKAVRIEVSLSARELYVYEGESRIRSYPVAIGKPAHPTPRGEFAIRRVIWNPGWVPPNAPWARGKRAREPGDPENPMGRAKIFFKHPDYYIHGTIDNASIGKAASHGCIRMRNADVVELARLVMEAGGEARPESWFTRVKNRVRTTQDVRLSRPVSVKIGS